MIKTRKFAILVASVLAIGTMTANAMAAGADQDAAASQPPHTKMSSPHR